MLHHGVLDTPPSVLGNSYLTGFLTVFKAAGVASQAGPCCCWLSRVEVRE